MSDTLFAVSFCIVVIMSAYLGLVHYLMKKWVFFTINVATILAAIVSIWFVN